MSELPFWKFPLIPRRKIIQRMRPEDVIEIALRSKPFYDVLCQTKLDADWISWRWERGPHNRSNSIQVQFSNPRRHTVTILLPIWDVAVKSDKTFDIYDVQHWRIHSEGTCDDTELRIELAEPELSNADFNEKLTKWLLAFIRTEDQRVSGDFQSPEELEGFYLWNHFKKFSRLEVRCLFPEKQIDALKFFNETLEGEEVHLQLHDSNTLDVAGEKYAVPLRGRKLTYKNVPFLHPDAVLFSSCVDIHLDQCDVCQSFSNAVLAKWANGGLGWNLQRFKVSSDNRFVLRLRPYVISG